MNGKKLFSLLAVLIMLATCIVCVATVEDNGSEATDDVVEITKPIKISSSGVSGEGSLSAIGASYDKDTRTLSFNMDVTVNYTEGSNSFIEIDSSITSITIRVNADVSIKAPDYEMYFCAFSSNAQETVFCGNGTLTIYLPFARNTTAAITTANNLEFRDLTVNIVYPDGITANNYTRGIDCGNCNVTDAKIRIDAGRFEFGGHWPCSPRTGP